MRIKQTFSKNSTSLYVIKDVFIDDKRTTKIVEALGTLTSIQAKHPESDPLEWARSYAKKLTEEEKRASMPIIRKYDPEKLIEKEQQRTFNGGYLFLQDIYHKLGLHDIFNTIATRHKYTFDLNAIASQLIYNRVLFPASKRQTYQTAQTFLEKPVFDLHHIYRGLDVIAKEADFIQAQLYKNSAKTFTRDASVLYYDCTNYFFEIEQEDQDGLRKYGVSKENRPNPIVQMGLFMDAEGIPLAFSLTSGNTNEQVTLKPLEQQILHDFGHSKFVVCTDAGLSSHANRAFNAIKQRAFITTQSIKKSKKFIKDWALDPHGWKISETSKSYDISTLDESLHFETIFYKERWINENGLEQKMIVTYSLKYRHYLATIRNNHIERAKKHILSKPKALGKIRQNDFKRFISTRNITADGEVAGEVQFSLNEEKVAQEAQFDGFYAVCTNLDEPVKKIIDINKKRWEIEECFRIMKTEFKARPVYLQRDERIKAHFMTCFLALVHYRFLEKAVDYNYTTQALISTLAGMQFEKLPGEGFAPLYTRTDITDALHTAFNFRTDTQIVTDKVMKKIIKQSKKR